MRKIVSIIFLMMITTASHAQPNPINWSYSALKLQNNRYEIRCQAIINAPWHIYSQYTPDQGPIPTKFDFAKNPLWTLEGKAIEEGKLLTKHEEVFGVDVKYFEGIVDFVQTIHLKVNAKTNVSGSVQFMVCSNTQCLPPQTVKFIVSVN